MIISADQQFSSVIAAFTRVGWRLEDQAINYRAIYSGGIDINGIAWDRLLDNIGLAVVYLDGGNGQIIRTRIAEGYYRMEIKPQLAFAFDIQYMRDEQSQMATAKGVIYSFRTTFVF